MVTTTSLTMGSASRYASALFSLAKEGKTIKKYEKDLDDLLQPLEGDKNLRLFVKSPVYSRDVQIKVMQKVSDKLGLSKDVLNTVLLMASNRRLFCLPEMIAHFKNLSRKHRNEMIVEVSSPFKLTDTLQKKINKTVSSNIDMEVVIKANYDPGLLGGLVVKIGSKMIDTSLKSKMIKLRNNLKEVG